MNGAIAAVKAARWTRCTGGSLNVIGVLLLATLGLGVVAEGIHGIECGYPQVALANVKLCAGSQPSEVDMRSFFIALSLFVAPLEAQNLTQFENGQVADAVAINDNFESIVDAIKDLQQEGRLLSGESDPGVLVGTEGDLYLNTVTLELWGPRIEDGWPLVASLKGSSCTVEETNGGIYVRCSDGTEAELSAPPTVQNPTIGTFSMEEQTIDLIGFEQRFERLAADNGTVVYSTMTLQYDTFSFIDFNPYANLDLSGATIVLSGGTTMIIDLQSFSVVSRSVVVGRDGASLTELALLTPQFAWTSPTSTLAVNQPTATSATDCAMPTTFSRTAGKSSEEAIDDVIWGQDLSNAQFYQWGSPQYDLGAFEFTDVKVSHSNLERLPCFFHAYSPPITVMTIQLDAASLTTLELGQASITEVAITVEGGEQSMVTSWDFTTRTETLGGTSYCFEVAKDGPC